MTERRGFSLLSAGNYKTSEMLKKSSRRHKKVFSNSLKSLLEDFSKALGRLFYIIAKTFLTFVDP
jgi:hypothetical protein